MRDWIEASAGDDGPIVLLGDFNTGPEDASYLRAGRGRCRVVGLG